MKKKIEKIYSLRTTFSIIGLTGRKGSGVSEVSKILSQNFTDNNIPIPKNYNQSNNDRRYTIVYNYAKLNWRPYTVINYKNVLFFHLLKYDFKDFLNFINQQNFKFCKNLVEIKKILLKYSSISNSIRNLGNIDQTLKNKPKLMKLTNLFLGKKFNSFVNEIDEYLKINFPIERIKFLQIISNNLRKSGNPYNETTNDEAHIYTIAEMINRIIKGIKILNPEAHIVINSLRNSLEIMFFKERYASFYMFAINSDKRREFLEKTYVKNKGFVSKSLKIDEEEYFGKFKNLSISNGDFFIQDVQNCIEKSDIYLSYNPALSLRKEITKYSFSKYKEESTKSLKIQIIKYTSLILHPGLITPSAQERCMQIAFSAKSNSGCISRQVGAVITDNNYSIKSIGWNDVPKYHTSCNLKNSKNLIDGIDDIAYSPYEKEKNQKVSEFYYTIKDFYANLDYSVCEGLNHSFCFKDFQSIVENYSKNQVHTRALHAEENTMLQIAKFGGQGLKNGILFTTASPCELCSKKARQLEITDIYYIDPYPGIAKWHILRDGTEVPNLILFAGAVGRAYSRLFEPIMSYKDELVLITRKNPKVRKTKLKM